MLFSLSIPVFAAEKPIRLKLCNYRDDIDMEEQIKKFTEEQQTHFVLVKEFPEVDVSSTNVRKKLEACKTDELTKELDEAVLKYILDNNLYCSKL